MLAEIDGHLAEISGYQPLKRPIEFLNRAALQELRRRREINGPVHILSVTWLSTFRRLKPNSRRKGLSMSDEITKPFLTHASGAPRGVADALARFSAGRL